MASFLTGVIGAFFVILLVSGGFALGWVAKGRIVRSATKEKERAMTEQEIATARRLRKEAEAEQKAFQDMIGYNIDVAYGVRAFGTGERIEGEADA